MLQHAQLVHRCPYNQKVLVTDEIRGEVFCENCGVVLAEKMLDSQRNEHIFTKDHLKNPRTKNSAKLYYADYGISTTIGNSTKDSDGNMLSGTTQRRFNRMRIWDNRTKKSGRVRSLATAFMMLDKMKSKLALSDSICEKSAYFYRKATELNIIRGRSIPAMLCASVYVACRKCGSPRSLDDIAKAANVHRKTLSKACMHLIHKMDLDVAPQDPIFFVNKIASKIGASEHTKRLAIRFLEKAKEKGITVSKRPSGMAGGAVYLAAAINNERISYPILKKATDTSSVTLRKRVKNLKKALRGDPEFLRVIP